MGLGVAGGDDESVDGGDEGSWSCFCRLRELYVRWTMEDISLTLERNDAQYVGDSENLRRRDAFLCLCLHLLILCMYSFSAFVQPLT